MRTGYPKGVDPPVSVRAALMNELRAGRGYGLDLIDRVSAASGGALVLSEGGVYSALAILERERLVTCTEDRSRASALGGRPRRYFELTPLGAREAGRIAVMVRTLFAEKAERPQRRETREEGTDDVHEPH